MTDLTKQLRGWREESRKLAEQDKLRKYSSDYKTQTKNYNSKIKYQKKH